MEDPASPPNGVSGSILGGPSDVVAPIMGGVGFPVSSLVFPMEGVASISPVEASTSPAITIVSLGSGGEAPASDLVSIVPNRNPIPAKGMIRRGFLGQVVFLILCLRMTGPRVLLLLLFPSLNWGIHGEGRIR